MTPAWHGDGTPCPGDTAAVQTSGARDMLLLIDAGNTRIKWALTAPASGFAPAVGPATWCASGTLVHMDIGQLGACWRQHCVSQVLISNVAGAAIRAALEQELRGVLNAAATVPAVSWFASVHTAGGVRNGYRNPGQLGCDRLAALIGARALRPAQALIVATCGTATTVDALTAEGHFVGGMILPGLGSMAAVLAQRTAHLPLLASLTPPPPVPARTQFADNTEAAIASGCIAAQAGAIDRAVAAHGNAHCLLSGGAAGWVLPYLQGGVTLVDNLVLTGLQVVALADPPGKTATLAVPQATTVVPGADTAPDPA